MSNYTRKRTRSLAKADPKAPPFYLAQYEGEVGKIFLRDKGGEPTAISVLGEILVAGQANDAQELVIENIERIALRSQPIDELGGAILLAGPANKIRLKSGVEGRVKTIELDIYHPLLSKREPACQENDATYPQLETLRGRLIWQANQPLEDKALGGRIILELNEVADWVEGAVRGFIFESPVLSFRLLSDLADSSSGANSLTECDATSAPLNSTNPSDPPKYKLRLQFYRVDPTATEAGLINLEGDVQPWIKGACEVWYKKGGLLIAPQGKILKKNAVPPAAGQTDPDFIEVYLVDDDLSANGGGYTDGCGGNYAYIVLQLSQATKQNTYLLAHELGHALGLYHPGECGTQCAKYRQGSFNSVIVPSGSTTANSDRNTVNNIEVIGQNLMAPNLLTTIGACRWNPDPDSTRLIEFIWNSDLELAVNYNDQNPATHKYSDIPPTNVFKPDGSPNRTVDNPGRTRNPDYSMYVRLVDCQPTDRPVKVYFYLAGPTVTQVQLLNNSNPLVFKEQETFSPDLRKPKTRYVKWQIPAINYPNGCSVFAVALNKRNLIPRISDIDPLQEITDPATGATQPLTFARLSALAASSNNVIGRPLTVPPL